MEFLLRLYPARPQSKNQLAITVSLHNPFHPSQVLRLFVLGGMLAVVALSFHFLVAFKNVYIYYIFKQSLSALLVGFILIKVYPYVLSKLGLDIQGDFLKAEEQQHRIVHA